MMATSEDGRCRAEKEAKRGRNEFEGAAKQANQGRCREWCLESPRMPLELPPRRLFPADYGDRRGERKKEKRKIDEKVDCL